jgi:ATP synthase protein I
MPQPPQPPSTEPKRDPLLDGLAAHRSRRARAEREGARPFFRSLGLIGGLGWVIVLPILAGLALGRWLDHHLGSGITATGALLAVGVAIGCRLAWKRMHQP